MKNILKTTIFAFLFISFVSCTNDKEPVAVLNGFELRDASEFAPPSVLLQDNESQTFIDLEWDRADYGVPTGNTGTTGLVYNIIVKDRDNPDPDGLVKSVISRTDAESWTVSGTVSITSVDVCSKKSIFCWVNKLNSFRTRSCALVKVTRCPAAKVSNN